MTTHRVAPGVRWVVGRHSLTILGGEPSERTLEYPEAAIWDLFSRGYAFEKVVSMITHIAGVESQSANELVRTAIGQWERTGLVERCEG